MVSGLFSPANGPSVCINVGPLTKIPVFELFCGVVDKQQNLLINIQNGIMNFSHFIPKRILKHPMIKRKGSRKVKIYCSYCYPDNRIKIQFLRERRKIFMDRLYEPFFLHKNVFYFYIYILFKKEKIRDIDKNNNWSNIF